MIPKRLCLAFLSCCMLSQSIILADDGMQPMFTDAQLTGWVRTNTPESTWSFKDDVLYCTGKPIGEIRTEKMYQNFVMELEWRHMVPRGNAGIFVWADDITSRGVPFHRGIEVQVLENAYGNNRSHTTHGDIFPIHGATMTPINGHGGSRAFPTEQRSKPSPQWNAYRIECRDGEISLAVNGKVVTRGKNCVPRKGYICLESEGGVVEYRNVRIKELPDSPIAPEHIAIANRGYVSIYSGLDLNGWKPKEPASWKPKDWVLAYEGKTNQAGELSSTGKQNTSSFVIDFRLKKPESSLTILAGRDFKINTQDETVAKALMKTNTWNRIESISSNGSQTLKINNEIIKLPSGSNRNASNILLQPTGPVDFANLYAMPDAN